MNTKAHSKYLFFLFAAIMVLLFAIPGAALAHHCKGGHASDPGCDGGGGGGGGGGVSDTDPIPLICSFAETEGDSFMGDGMGPYVGGEDRVACTTGDTLENSGTSRIRWYTFGSGTLRRAIRKVDVVIDEDSCSDAAGCAAVPNGVFEPAGGIADDMEDGRFFVLAYDGTDGLDKPHIQELTPNFYYSVMMDFNLMGTSPRWSFQLRNQPTCAPQVPDPDLIFDDATLYTWPDGDGDGRPDGYTLTTAESLNTGVLPPTVTTAGTRIATLCSNEGIDGSGCGGEGGSDLCQLISQMEMQFTWHAEVQ